MAFSEEFLVGRSSHLVAKLRATCEAAKREGIMPSHQKYKVSVLIPQITAAIKRIEDNTYGFCIDCEIEIDNKRLLKNPHVERCVSCQIDHERIIKIRSKTYADH